MANGTASPIQLPPGYEDATPVAGPLATQSQSQAKSGISLPPGYEDAQPVAGPLAQQTPASAVGQPFDRISDAIGGVAKGFAKGAGDTVSGVSHLLNKIPVVGETLAPSQGVSALDQVDVAHGTAEAAGKGLEGIAEWAAGDELLEGLSKGTRLVALAKKYPLINEVMGMAKEHPLLAKIIAGGTVGTAEGGLKGAQQNQAVKGALVGGVGGAAAGAAAGIVPSVVKAIPPNPLRRAVSAVADPFTGSAIQPALKDGIQDVWNTVADTAGVARPTTKSVQDLGEQVGDSILARSKANYGAIDAATGGRFSGTEQALKAVNRDLRSVTNDAEEQALNVRKTRLELQMNQMMDDAESKGVPKVTVDAAKNDFKQAQAIYDTNHQIRMSTTGVRPGMTGSEGVPEAVNAKPLMNRLNKLYNSGRLQQAVGDDGANDLIGHTATAQTAATKVARNVRNAKIAGTVVGVPVGGAAAGAAYEGVQKLFE